MCGRYVAPHTTDELLSLSDPTGNDAADWHPSYRVAPTDPPPVVRAWVHYENTAARPGPGHYSEFNIGVMTADAGDQNGHTG